jgi:hypothetical protein
MIRPERLTIKAQEAFRDAGGTPAGAAIRSSTTHISSWRC